MTPDARVTSLSKAIMACLDEHKAEESVTIPLAGLSEIADYMIIASGFSTRHVQSLHEHLLRLLKDKGCKEIAVEGEAVGDWILVDAGDIIIHLFRPEIRELYRLEKLWGSDKAIQA